MKVKKLLKENQAVIVRYRKHRESLNKRDNTLKTDCNAVRKLAYHLGKTRFEDASEDDLKAFFVMEKNYVLRDHYACRIICFYRWLLRLPDDGRPVMMVWYRYSTSDDRERQKKVNLKESLMTPDEYAKVIQSVKMDLRMSALYETLYLSGARPDEVCKMKVKDVLIEQGKVSVRVVNSKSLPREVPLSDKPVLLLRWLENHPYSVDKDAWLFPSLDRRFKNVSVAESRHINAGSLSDKFRRLVVSLHRLDPAFKETLILYSFRKTRATIMFNQNYDDKEMGMLFGWKPHTVIDRRNEYDLRGLDDLKSKIFQKSESYRPPEAIEQENKLLAESLQQELGCLRDMFMRLLNLHMQSGGSLEIEGKSLDDPDIKALADGLNKLIKEAGDSGKE